MSFRVGGRVRVSARAHDGHHRTPGYLKGKSGTVERVHDAFVTTLDVKGGFGFDNGEDNHGTQRLINCMASYGFTFPNAAVSPRESFAPEVDAPDPPVRKAEK